MALFLNADLYIPPQTWSAGTGHCMSCIFALTQYSCSQGQSMQQSSSKQQLMGINAKCMDSEAISEADRNFLRVKAWQKPRKSACKILPHSNNCIFT